MNSYQKKIKSVRSGGAVGKNAVVPRLVGRLFKNYKGLFLDFGAGPKAIHTKALRDLGLNVTAYDLPLPAMKDELPWLKEVGSQSIQYAVRNLDTAYKNFFRTKKGFPKFKSKHKKDSFRITQNVRVQDSKVIIPKFLEGIEYIPDPRKIEGKIEFATITKNKAGQYFVSITTTKDIQLLPKIDTVIGLDFNKKDIVDSNGNHYLNPCPAKKHRKQVRVLQKALSRTKKGTKEKPESNGRKEARQKLAKLHLHIHNVREDYLHKLSKKIVDENQVICIEDLSVESMLKNVPIEKRKQMRWEEKKHQQVGGH